MLPPPRARCLQATRAAMQRAALNRCAECTAPLLTQLLEDRHAAAQLLGHADHAHYLLQTTMAREPAAVQAKLDEFVPVLRPAVARQLGELKEMRAQRGGAGEDEAMAGSDVAFFSRLLKEQKYGVDEV